jgi:pyruvate/2-oxoglutarate dehydrogenase complex dihydrolipoamide dehydrogenase (E3) component
MWYLNPSHAFNYRYLFYLLLFTMPLKVGIVGAGIGGLSAAIALRRTGAQVEVFSTICIRDQC